MQIRQRTCLLETSGCVLSSGTQRAGESSLPKCHHAEYFQVYLLEALTLQLPGSSGLHSAVSSHSQFLSRAEWL